MEVSRRVHVADAEGGPPPVLAGLGDGARVHDRDALIAGVLGHMGVAVQGRITAVGFGRSRKLTLVVAHPHEVAVAHVDEVLPQLDDLKIRRSTVEVAVATHEADRAGSNRLNVRLLPLHIPEMQNLVRLYFFDDALQVPEIPVGVGYDQYQHYDSFFNFPESS